MAYNPKNFLNNVNGVIQEKEKRQKNQAIAGVIVSLQQPLKKVLNSIIVKQVTDVEALLKQVKYK